VQETDLLEASWRAGIAGWVNISISGVVCRFRIVMYGRRAKGRIMLKSDGNGIMG
jgi:hypothetical protein